MILIEEFRSGVLHELTRRHGGEGRQKIVCTPDLAFNKLALRPQSVFMGCLQQQLPIVFLNIMNLLVFLMDRSHTVFSWD